MEKRKYNEELSEEHESWFDIPVVWRKIMLWPENPAWPQSDHLMKFLLASQQQKQQQHVHMILW